MSDFELVKKFVSVFPQYDRDAIVIESNVAEEFLVSLEKRLPAAFPPLYRSLLLHYSFSNIDLDDYCLFGDEVDHGTLTLEKSIFLDKCLYPVLHANSYIQIGKGREYTDYDPVCFDIKNNCSIVKLDHESILIYQKIRIVGTLASSFMKLVEKTIANAPH